MSTGDNLSTAQFGDVDNATPPTPEPIRAPINEGPANVPLPYSTRTNSSAKQAAVWRKPTGISYSSATSGSVFDPYSNT